MKISEAVEDYVLEIEIRKYAERTVATYRDKIRCFGRFCEDEIGIHELREVTSSHVKRYTQYMLKRGCKGSYINSCLKSIKSWMAYSYEEHGEGFDASRGGIRWVKEDRPRIPIYTPKDVRKMLGNCKGRRFTDIRDAAIITMLFETGIRSNELCSIRPSDIQEGFIVIAYAKGGKHRAVPITPILKKAMLRFERVRESYFSCRRNEPFYFLSFTGKRLTHSGMQHILNKRSEGITGARCSPHTCRHFYAQQQLKNKMDVYSLSRLLGHESVSITTAYLRSLGDADIVEMARQSSVLMSL